MSELRPNHHESWGAALRRHREAANLTQENVAQAFRRLSQGALATTGRSIHDWETQDSVPRRVNGSLVNEVELYLLSTAAENGTTLERGGLVRAFEARKVAFPKHTETDALHELTGRARRQGDLAMYAITAHNVDEIYTVDRLAADHETKLPPPICASG